MILKRREYELTINTIRKLDGVYENEAIIKITASTTTKLIEKVKIEAEIFPLDFESTSTRLEYCVVDLVQNNFTLVTTAGSYETSKREYALALCLGLDAPEIRHGILSLPEFVKKLYYVIQNDEITLAQQLINKLRNRK